MERLRCSTWISVRETIRPRVLAPVPAGRRRRRCEARHMRARSVKSKSTAPQTALRRTDEQTAYAVWWMEFAEGSVNRLARQLAVDRNLHLWKAARLFAHVGVALYDTYVATWDSKYVYDHWRPYTAIRDADTDGNPRTSPDAIWVPLRPTPPFPEYVSAHAAACGASFGVLQQAFGRRVLVHDGDDDRATRHADANVYQLRCGGRRVCRFTREARLAFPVLDQRGPRAWEAGRTLRAKPLAADLARMIGCDCSTRFGNAAFSLPT